MAEIMSNLDFIRKASAISSLANNYAIKALEGASEAPVPVALINDFYQAVIKAMVDLIDVAGEKSATDATLANTAATEQVKALEKLIDQTNQHFSAIGGRWSRLANLTAIPDTTAAIETVTSPLRY